MITAEREVVLYLPAQHHLCVLQRIVVQQPVKFSSLCRGIAVFVLNGDTVDGKGGAIFKSGRKALFESDYDRNSDFVSFE